MNGCREQNRPLTWPAAHDTAGKKHCGKKRAVVLQIKEKRERQTDSESEGEFEIQTDRRTEKTGEIDELPSYGLDWGHHRRMDIGF